MSWQDDPVSNTSSTSEPWKSDPVTNTNAKTGQPYTPPSSSAAMNTLYSGVTAIPAAIGNAAHTIGQLESGKPDTGGLDTELQQFNAKRASWMEGNPAAKAADIAGQVAIPMGATEGLASKATSMLPEAAQKGLTGFAARSAARGASGYAQGVGTEAEQAHTNVSNEKLYSELSEAGKTGAMFNSTIGGAADLAKPFSNWYKGNISKSTEDTTNRATKDLSDVTSDRELQAGKQYIATPKTQRPLNLSTAEATATPNDKGQPVVSSGLASQQNVATSGQNVPNKGFDATANSGESQVSPARIFEQQNTGNKDVVANELSNLKGGHEATLENAPTSVQAGKELTIGQKLAEERSRLAYNEKYNGIDANKTIDVPIHDKVRENQSTLLDGNTNNFTNAELTHGFDTISKDDILAKADIALTGSSLSAGAQIDLKNELRSHASDMYNQAENLTPGSKEQRIAFARGKLASQMAENVVDNLKRATNVTTAAGKTISDEVIGAENMYKEHQKNFMENPDTFSSITTKATNSPMKNMPQGTTVANGQVEQQIGQSKSETAKLFGRAYNQSEAAPATEATKLLDSSNPANFDSQVKSLKATAGGEQFIQNKILGDVKSAGGDKGAFDKYYGPEQSQTLRENSFNKAADTLDKAHGQALYDDIKNQVLTKDATTGQASINTQKFGSLLDEHEKQLRDTLGDVHFERLREIQQTNAVLDQVAGIAGKNTPEAQTKEVLAILKGGAQKGFKISYSALNAITSSLGSGAAEKVRAIKAQLLADPDRAIPLIEAMRNGNKDPKGIVSQIMSLGAKAAPSVASAIPAHTDSNLDNEVKNATKPQSNNTSNFNLISDANANELPEGNNESNRPNASVTDSKKNSSGEYQVADASATTGMPKEYFTALEKAETQGNKDPNHARPLDENGKPKSSAYGLSQFTEKTWNDVAQKHNLPLITDTNRLKDNDPRSNPKYSRLAAGYYGSDNADSLRPWLKDNFEREPTVGDVYGAHLMGLSGIKQFLSANPDSPADKVVPQAAKNNKSLFYGEDGKSLSIRQVYTNIENRLLPNKKDTDANTNTNAASR